MKKKLSLLLVGCLVASTNAHSFWRKPKPWHTQFFQTCTETCKGLTALPFLGAAITTMALLLKRKALNEGADFAWDEGKKFFGFGEENKRLKQQNVKIEKADVDFENFDTETIPSEVQEFRKEILIHKALKLQNAPLANEIEPAKYILFYGPTQTGKSTCARALAKTDGAEKFVCTTGAELKDKFVGESTKTVHNVFDAAESLGTENTPGCLIIDEVDRGISTANSNSTKVTNDISGAIQGIIDNGKNRNIRVYFTTNFNTEEDIPAAIRSRCKLIYVGNPNAIKRRHLLQHKFAKENIRIKAPRTTLGKEQKLRGHLAQKLLLKQARLYAHTNKVLDEIAKNDYTKNFNISDINKIATKVKNKNIVDRVTKKHGNKSLSELSRELNKKEDTTFLTRIKNTFVNMFVKTRKKFSKLIPSFLKTKEQSKKRQQSRKTTTVKELLKAVAQARAEKEVQTKEACMFSALFEEEEEEEEERYFEVDAENELLTSERPPVSAPLYVAPVKKDKTASEVQFEDLDKKKTEKIPMRDIR